MRSSGPEDRSKKGYRRLRSAVIVITAAGLLVWLCRTHVPVEPPPPPDSAQPVELAATTSELSLAVVLPADSIRKILEEKVPNPIQFDGKDDWHVYGSLGRKPITVRPDVPSQRVDLGTTVEGKVQAEKDFPITGRFSVGVQVKGTLAASLSPLAGKDGSVEPNMTLDPRLDKATVNVPVLGDQDVTGIIRGVVGNKLGDAKKAAEQEVRKVLDLKADVERAWNQINGVHQISTSPPAWLRTTPKKATFGQLEYRPDAIVTGLAVEVETRVFVQDSPPEVPAAPFPGLTLAAAVPGRFRLSIPVEVSYDTINQKLREQLKQHSLSSDGDVAVTITDAAVAPYGAGVLLTVKFQARNGFFRSASGTMYITGVPTYDAGTQELRVGQLNYTAETNNVLLRSAEWLARARILDKMKDAAVLNLGHEVGRAREKADEGVVALKASLPKEAAWDVAVTGLAVERIAFAKDRAFAVVTADGTLSARLQK
jgi:hypothetical protein